MHVSNLILVALLTFSVSPATATATIRWRRCEYRLQTESSNLEASHSLHLDAYMDLMATLDFSDQYVTPTVAAGLTEAALQPFNLHQLSPQQYRSLRMRSDFDRETDPELSLYLESETKELKLLKLLMGRGRRELYFWKRVGTRNDSRQDIVTEFLDSPMGHEWDRLPPNAQVGFKTVVEEGDHSIYVAVQRLTRHSFQINVGLDVDCEWVDEYVQTRRFVERIIRPAKVQCRVPVLRYRGAI